MSACATPVNSTWFVAQLRPNQHVIAGTNLLRQGVEYFMPELVREKLTSKGPRTHRSPLFPGYLFVSIDLSAPNWAKVRNTRGISRLVSFGNGMPCPLPTTFVEELKERMGTDGQLLPEPALAPGNVVRVVNGPFADFIGSVQRLDDVRRAWVLLDFLGQVTRVGIGIRNLELVQSGDA